MEERIKVSVRINGALWDWLVIHSRKLARKTNTKQSASGLIEKAVLKMQETEEKNDQTK